jgi:acyl-homoserine-lactone acylase
VIGAARKIGMHIWLASWLVGLAAPLDAAAAPPPPRSPAAKQPAALQVQPGAKKPAGKQAPPEKIPVVEQGPPTAETESARAARLAADVTISRDAYGVPHVDGRTDEAALFGFAYAQAEDYFWQVEDNYILCQGRYAEVHGARGLNSDLLNRAFEIVPQSKTAFAGLAPQLRTLCEAFVAGLNFYLATHPETKPRLIERFEPWQVLAYGRHMILELSFRRTGLSNTYLPRAHDLIWAASGSNGWAIAPAKTANGHAMLLANPHLPWFGFSQMFEAHVRSAESWNFTGAATYGSPILSLGHNEHLGWTLTTNEPDIADVWRLKFDDPAQPLNYRYGEGYRTAVEWHETIGVLTPGGIHQRGYTLRKSHYGPVVAKEDDHTFLAARIAGTDNTLMLRQSLNMMRAGTLAEFRAALEMQQLTLMNILYADQAGNIYYLYNGLVPRRDPALDWAQPLDGADPRAQWQGIHPIAELPQLLNPASGYLQNCNSSPFTTCDEGNPDRASFPRYLADDADDDKRRAKRSREILSEMQAVTFADVEQGAFDTTVYWAKHELPKYAEEFARLQAADPKLAAEVEPYVSHLMKWDCRITASSTAATLCDAWYTELYGRDYPGETMRRRYEGDPERQFRALAKAAGQLKSVHGTWRVRWADLFRMQRHTETADLIELPFSDREPSLSCLAGPGPMGIVFTQYYAPSLRIPFFKNLKNRYALIGPTYLAVYEFGPKVRGASAAYFGASGDPASPHFQDQAELISACKLKPELFDWQEIAAAAREKYHPGERRAAAEKAQGG